jgi:hypothetical protein
MACGFPFVVPLVSGLQQIRFACGLFLDALQPPAV